MSKYARNRFHGISHAVYLIHWPIALNPKGNHPAFPTLPNGLRDVVHSWKLSDTWKQMEALVQKGKSAFLYIYIFKTKPHDHHIGKVKTIGISNFSVKKIEEILPSAEIIPAVNQVCKKVSHNIHSLK